MALDAACEVLLTFTEFATPSTEVVDFDACIGGAISTEARNLLREATHTRRTLVQSLDNGNYRVDPRNVVGGVDLYLPALYKITRSMEESASAQITLVRPLEFKWNSVLVKAKNQKRPFTHGTLVYELSFMLTIRALAHYNTARLLLDPENSARTDNLVNASKELRKGAGVLEFVAQVLLPRWIDPPAQRPPEVRSAVVRPLCNMFLAMAQRITVVQAILKGSAPSVIAKLLLGLSDRYTMINQEIRQVERAVYDTLTEPLVDEAPLMATVCYSLGLRYLGEAAKADAKPGEAVAYTRFASENIMRATYTAAMAKLYQSRLDEARSDVDVIFHECRDENEKVYFDAVPTRERLKIPDGQFIVNPQDFSMPEVDTLSFASRDAEAGAAAAAASADKGSKRSSLSNWFSFGSSKGGESRSTTSAASAAAGGYECPPGYDKEVFDSLPDDIKREVVEQHRAGRS